MKYVVIIAVVVGVFLLGSWFLLAGDPQPDKPRGLEFTAEDWERCEASLSESLRRSGQPTMTALPTWGVDGQFYFVSVKDGELEACEFYDAQPD